MVNIFSYDHVQLEGFKVKQGLTTSIDLLPELSALWENTRKRFVREQINKGERNGIKVVVMDDWEKLVPVYKEFREGKKIANDNPKVFKECFIVNAYVDGKVIAGGAFVADGTYMRALALASRRFQQDGKLREIVGQANRMVIWEAMVYAKNNGYREFDLGGINPDSAQDWERSLAEFKESFGGVRKPCYYYSKVNSSLLRLIIDLRRLIGV